MILGVVCSVLTVIQFSQGIQTVTRRHRSFEVDYDNDQFLKDGEPFRYISGSVHYFRVPRAYWQDRLRKLRAAGLNAVSTYIEWNLHEPTPGVYNFEGENDFEHFVRLAEEENLLVILRPGPYICAERDFGGYPSWLLYENPNIKLRTNDSSHTKYVYSWLNVLLPRIQPLLYGNGGPVIMVQVENEYGSYDACDRNYTSWLRDVLRSHVTDNAVLFTTDGNDSSFLKCGPIPGVFTTVDFGCGGNVTKDFADLRKVQPHGPLVNSEFYPGWLTMWGNAKEATVGTGCVVDTTRQLLLLNASFNYYMFHGGTNFGLSSGADPEFLPVITSYDYDAPISESGNLTEKYYAIKSVLAEFHPQPDVKVDHSEPVDYGTVVFGPATPLFGSSSEIKYGTFQHPKTFESLQLFSGLMLYQTTLPSNYTGRGYLVADKLHDRTIVYVNKEPAGILSRTKRSYSMIIGGLGGQPLSLLVENQGHLNYGNKISFDSKGLIGNITLNGQVLTGWKHTGYPLTNNVSGIATSSNVTGVKLPAYFSGTLKLPQAHAPYQDTFVDTTGWGKGVLWVNDFCLGRYWPTEGPQMSLYLPGSRLRALNTVTVLELEKVKPEPSMRLEARPRWKRASGLFHTMSASDNILVRDVDSK